jgi:hypothetical protein
MPLEDGILAYAAHALAVSQEPYFGRMAGAWQRQKLSPIHYQYYLPVNIINSMEVHRSVGPRLEGRAQIWTLRTRQTKLPFVKGCYLG